MMSSFPRLVLLLLLLVPLPACGAALVGAGVAIGVWAYDENAEDGGTIVLPHRPDAVFRAAEAVVAERGATEVEVARGSRRIECRIDDVNIKIHALEVMGQPEVTELKIRARTLWRARADLAEDLAAAIQDRLG